MVKKSLTEFIPNGFSPEILNKQLLHRISMSAAIYLFGFQPILFIIETRYNVMAVCITIFTCCLLAATLTKLAKRVMFLIYFFLLFPQQPKSCWRCISGTAWSQTLIFLHKVDARAQMCLLEVSSISGQGATFLGQKTEFLVTYLVRAVSLEPLGVGRSYFYTKQMLGSRCAFWGSHRFWVRGLHFWGKKLRFWHICHIS